MNRNNTKNTAHPASSYLTRRCGKRMFPSNRYRVSGSCREMRKADR